MNNGVTVTHDMFRSEVAWTRRRSNVGKTTGEPIHFLLKGWHHTRICAGNLWKCMCAAYVLESVSLAVLQQPPRTSLCA